jgi:hypothetical protein
LVADKLEHKWKQGVGIDIEHLVDIKVNLASCRLWDRPPGGDVADVELAVAFAIDWLGSEYPIVLDVKRMLALSYDSSRQLQSERNILLETVRDTERVWGANASECLFSKRLLADVYLEDKATLAEGMNILIEIFPLHVERFGPSDPYHTNSTHLSLENGIDKLEYRQETPELKKLLQKVRHLLAQHT